MSQPISLKAAERKVFRTTFSDGLIDIFLGCFFLMFAFAPLLSKSLGDFWSSVVFLPFWGIVYLILQSIRKHVVLPRIGNVSFGNARKTRLVRFNLIMPVVNVLALILGIVAATYFMRVPGQIIALTFGFILLAAFSIAAYFLDVKRFYVYGLLTAISPLVGEWLYTYHGATHHGYPIVFGIMVTMMALVGILLFVRLLRLHPDPHEDIPLVEV
ncbi:MAG: hypothetical protein JXA97_12530 [Anaerolineales bacterium]|nr:hypothetical protein [Anaerolineales bacterium]